jgi:hypothetical protein
VVGCEDFELGGEFGDGGLPALEACEVVEVEDRFAGTPAEEVDGRAAGPDGDGELFHGVLLSYGGSGVDGLADGARLGHEVAGEGMRP